MGTQFYLMMVILMIVLLIAYIVVKKIRKKREADVETKTSTMIDQMSMRRASINTAYMEKDFFNSVYQLIYSYYAQNPQSIPGASMTSEFYMEWYNRIKREYELGIAKQVFNINMDNPRVTKQDNSSMYTVTRIEVEAKFVIEYYYSHATLQKKARKSFKQRFVFLNNNDAWLLEKALPEQDVHEENI